MKSDINVEYLQNLSYLVLDSLPFRIFWKDTDLNYLGANKLFLEDAGIKDRASLIGKSDYDCSWNNEQGDSFRSDDCEVISSGKAKINIEEPMNKADGTTYWLLTNKIPLKDQSGNVIGVLGTYDDITDHVHNREELKKQALYDALTGLANRRYLHNAIAGFKGEKAGLLFIDLDHFKDVNDTLGHSFGDVLLKFVARRLLEIIGEKGLVARLGGDEFSIFIPLHPADEKASVRHLSAIAEQIIQSILRPFVLKDHILNLGASIGITQLNQQTCREPGDCFREADMAMYVAKSMGRNTFRFYDQSMRDQSQRRHTLQSNLREAVTGNEFSLVFQPQADRHGKLIGAEALLRWQNPELGSVPPLEFIPLAERTGLIHAIGFWVLEKALDTLTSWSHIIQDIPDFKLAINVSSKQFQNREFVQQIRQALEARPVPPAALQIEITESLFIDDQDYILVAINELKSLGVSLSVDDFGTGYSCLSYLANLPIDQLKIDKTFVDNLGKHDKNTKLVGAIISIAKSLEIRVIAEGVESVEEKERLVSLGCRNFQGFFFSKPLPSRAFLESYPGPFPLSVQAPRKLLEFAHKDED